MFVNMRFLIRSKCLVRKEFRFFHGPAVTSSNKKIKVKDLPKCNINPVTDFESLRQTIQNLNTVEEKLYYYNLPKQFGWYSVLLNDTFVPFQSQEFLCYATQTKILNVKTLPETYDDLFSNLPNLDKFIPHIKNYIQDFRCNVQKIVDTDKIPFHESGSRLNYVKRKEECLNSFIMGLNHLLSRCLLPTSKHLLESQLDAESRVEAFWFKGGFHPDRKMILKREGTHKKVVERHFPSIYRDKSRIYDFVDKAIQYSGRHLLTLRSKTALPFFVNNSHEIVTIGTIDKFPWDPRCLGYSTKNNHGTIVGSVWPTSPYKFSILQYIDMVNKADNASNESGYHSKDGMSFYEIAQVKALQGSFASTFASASYLGFGPFHNPTTPLTTQTIVTDGNKFQLNAFQLNITELSKENSENDLKNILWSLPEEELVKWNSEGVITDLNINLLKNLLVLYTLKPERKSIETPYLNPKFKHIHEIPNEYNRDYFMKEFMRMYSKRGPRTQLQRPEIQAWEKVHLIDNPRSLSLMGLRERPFFKMAEVSPYGKEHWHPEFVKYNYYKPKLIPKKFQKDNQKYAKQISVPVSIE